MRILLVAILLSFAATAGAEPVRHGLMLGASLGAGGATACNDCSRLAGGAAEIHVGAWLTPEWALSYEAWVFTGDPTHFVYDSQGAALATLTSRLAPRIWLKAGAGLAMYQHDDMLTDQVLDKTTAITHKGLGLGSGIGYELYQSRGSIVIDVSARSMLGVYPDHGATLAGSALLGVTWN